MLLLYPMQTDEIINLIKPARIEAGLSQNQLAIKAKTSKADISNIEASKRNERISLTKVINICNALDLTIVVVKK